MNAIVKTESSGLRGQTAGETALCTVGQHGTGLSYRGYDITDLANGASFEEVAYLLLRGELPSAHELAAYQASLQRLRGLPASLKHVLEQIPAHAHPMDVLRTGTSVLGNLEPEDNFECELIAADRLIAVMPSILTYWYRYANEGVRINTQTDEVTTAGHFLRCLHGAIPHELHVNALDTSLILYAEHEFNASTFVARVSASTLTDLHSCVTGAIGALRGRLHGGANEAAMDMLAGMSSVEDARAQLFTMLKRNQKIMGFGHAVYRDRDPRNDIIKQWSRRLAEEAGDLHLYEISCEIEALMQREKGLPANADFYHASTYHYLGIPRALYTPIFVCSRVSGWSAHVFEQRGNNRIIRPSARYVGPAPRQFEPLALPRGAEVVGQATVERMTA